jgi:glycosyltransferase involved in cell wall biosynthesis
MPCYNAAGTLDEAAASLARQTLADFEVVAVDDGSTDATGQILERWSARDNRFRVLHRSHEGIIAALNAGLRECRSPFIARMDGDDRSHPERLARQVAFLHEHPQLAVAGCQVAGYPPGAIREGFRIYLEWLNGLLDESAIRREIFVESPLPHPSVIYRRDMVEQVGGYLDFGWPEDYDLWLRLHLAGASFAKLPEVLLEWRDDPRRLTRTDSRYSLENFLRLKAHYLALGPLAGREAVFIWGAGMAGRRLSKHLLREGVRLEAFFDIDPHKIGNTRRGYPILPPEELPEQWSRYRRPALLAAVGARHARPVIRRRLENFGLKEGEDWWAAA